MKGGREFSEEEVSFASGDIVHHYRNFFNSHVHHDYQIIINFFI